MWTPTPSRCCSRSTSRCERSTRSSRPTPTKTGDCPPRSSPRSPTWSSCGCSRRRSTTCSSCRRRSRTRRRRSHSYSATHRASRSRRRPGPERAGRTIRARVQEYQFASGAVLAFRRGWGAAGRARYSGAEALCPVFGSRIHVKREIRARHAQAHSHDRGGRATNFSRSGTPFTAECSTAMKLDGWTHSGRPISSIRSPSMPSIA